MTYKPAVWSPTRSVSRRTELIEVRHGKPCRAPTRSVAERGYCLALLQARGNANVPNSAVPGYLKVQAVNADRGNAPDLARAYRFAAVSIEGGDWQSAWQALNYATVGLRTTGPIRHSRIVVTL